MGRLKTSFLNKVKASSITEVLVATSILLLVFAIALGSLSTIMVSSTQKNTHAMEMELEKLMYQYKNEQLKVPISYSDGDFVISVQQVIQNQIIFIEFSMTNSINKKNVTKKQLFYESE